MINNYITFALLTASFLYGQDSPQSVDGVAAVVGENIILKSDVSQVVGMTALQRGLDVTKDVDLLPADRVRFLRLYLLFQLNQAWPFPK